MENIDKKYLAIAGIIIIIFIAIIIYAINSKENIQEDVFENLEIVENNKEIKKELIKIHVAGAVVSEGLVELEKGARVEDAIKSAGGTTVTANIKDINLAQKLQDGQKIYIPEQGEEGKDNSENYNAFKTDKININTATQTELELLTGIGPSMASKIINYRDKQGSFSSIEEIKEVSGIGEAKYEAIKDEITV